MIVSPRSVPLASAIVLSAALVALDTPLFAQPAGGPAEPAGGPAEPTGGPAQPDAPASQPEPDVPPGQPEPPRMTLDDALAYAKAHQPTVSAARARIAAAQSLAAIPRAQWYPQLTAGFEILGGTSNNSTASYLSPPGLALPRIGGTKAITTDDLTTDDLVPYASSLAGISIQQELFDFGRIAAQAAALDALTDVEKYRAQADELDVTLAVEESYFAVQAAHRVLDSAKAAEARAKSDAAKVAAAIKSGLRPPADQARADADIARAEVGTIRAEGSLDLARGILAAAIGSKELRVDATPDEPKAAELPPLEKSLADGDAHDPELAIARAQVRAQQANTAALGSERRPNLILSSTISGRAGGAPIAGSEDSIGKGFLPLIPNYDLGVVLSVPLFDGVTRAKEDASRAREEAYREQADVVKQRGVEAIERAHYSAAAARAALPALERALAAAQLAHDQAVAQFDSGVGTAVDLADAEALLTQAEVDLAIGKFAVARADATLARATAEAP